jgi:hypothetical protein
MRFDKAKHSCNIILAICGKYDALVESTKHRLKNFFNVKQSSIQISKSASSVIFYLSRQQDAYEIDWYHKDNNSFSASAYPIIDKEILDDKASSSLRQINTRFKGHPPDIWKVNPPFCYFHQNRINDSFFCANDFLGVGRLYYFAGNKCAIFSSSLVALCLALPKDPEENLEYWNGYFTTGGGLGKLTNIKDVFLAPPGSKLTYISGEIKIYDTHSYKKLLNLKKAGELHVKSPIKKSIEIIRLASPYLENNLKLGVSGGRDSRLIAALLLKEGIKFSAYTQTPPALEATVAKKLFDVLPQNIKWTERNGGLAREAKNSQSILGRGISWASFNSGESWSTLLKGISPHQSNVSEKIELTGFAGEIARGHYYTSSDIDVNFKLRILSFLNSYLKNREIIPNQIKINTVEKIKADMFDAMVDGIDGLYVLDYFFALNRIRRQYPIFYNNLAPLFTPEMAIETFFLKPRDKLHASYIVKQTNNLVPEWSSIPYEHELRVGTDPNVTNKSYLVPTWWEIDREDFFDTLNMAISSFPDLEWSIKNCEDYILKSKESRPLKSSTFEFVFWRLGVSENLKNINITRHHHHRD